MLTLFFVYELAAQVLAAGNFVGAERCRACHESAYKTWAQSQHSRALLAVPQEQKKELRCTLCHTLSPDEDDAKLAGVQCESCHGAGRYYTPTYVMRDKELVRAVGLVDPTEQTCRRCHDDSSPSIEPFNYAEAWKRIAHGKESAAK